MRTSSRKKQGGKGLPAGWIGTSLIHGIHRPFLVKPFHEAVSFNDSSPHNTRLSVDTTGI